jgi:hypothetical protein
MVGWGAHTIKENGVAIVREGLWVYSRSTNELVILGDNGMVVSYFRPGRGEAYVIDGIKAGKAAATERIGLINPHPNGAYQSAGEVQNHMHRIGRGSVRAPTGLLAPSGMRRR